jgi:lactate 2-monooxygenase
MSRAAWGERLTMDSNRAAFRKWSIIPKMLRDNTHRDLKTELFGEVYEALC